VRIVTNGLDVVHGTLLARGHATALSRGQKRSYPRASLEITSRPGSGTKIALHFPAARINFGCKVAAA